MISNFMYKNFYNILALKNNYDKNNLGAYFAGLIEGDGHIYTPLTLRNTDEKKNAPFIEICFDIKDLPLFEKIKEVLYGGYITIRPNNKRGRLFIKKKVILLKLINLINGHMHIPKIEALHIIFQGLNNESSDYHIKPLYLDTSALEKK